jgi:predicted kinase
VLRGLPGCGKSTFAKELQKQEPNRWKRINRDDLRLMFHGVPFDPSTEDFITTIQDQMLRTCLTSGLDVILDNTHLNPTVMKKIHQLAKSIGDVKVVEKCFNVEIQECVLRNSKRDRQVSTTVIYDMAHAARIDKGRKLEDKETYYEPKQKEQTIVQDESLPRAIMCDLDGTLALLNGRNPYDASTCENDVPNMSVVSCVEAMYKMGHKIIFMSGRDAKHMAPTVKFIEKHLSIPYELYMRPTGDQRRDSIVKKELFDKHVAGKFFIEFVLDDRDQVVEGWRNMGLSTFQVNYGDF